MICNKSIQASKYRWVSQRRHRGGKTNTCTPGRVPIQRMQHTRTNTQRRAAHLRLNISYFVLEAASLINDSLAIPNTRRFVRVLSFDDAGSPAENVMNSTFLQHALHSKYTRQLLIDEETDSLLTFGPQCLHPVCLCKVLWR
jgi:hypothetical protein